MELREVTYLAVALRILMAVILGGLLGLERELKNRPAGMRTYMLVCSGACLMMLTNQYIFQVFGTGDPVRMGAQVVSGIGLLGAGTISVTKHSQIQGLTTAAGLWTSAGVGLALGLGFYEAAVIGCVASVVVMTLLQRMDSKIHRKTKRMDIYFELEAQVPLGDFLRAVRSLQVEVNNVERESVTTGENAVRCYTATVTQFARGSHIQLLENIRDIPGILWAEEL